MPKYRLADQAPLQEGGNRLQRQLLHARGVIEQKDIEAFLSPDYVLHLYDPFLLHDMEKAVVRILEAIKNNEKITIFSDYDCDGIPGAVVLHDFFKTIGYTNFTNYIPHRHYEGFGLSVDAVEKLVAEGTQLIVTIDCGTSDIEAVDVATRAGVGVIITDHHEPKADLPKAVAIVNPKLGKTYPFDGLCGAGVVFKLVVALIERGDFDIKPGWEKWWLDMVGIATISDMVPLVDENRIFATYGLQVLRKSRRPGLQHLLKKAGANQRYLTEDDIGFTIGPRINAASRMDTPEDAFLMLATEDEAEAGERVRHLEGLNNERKGLVASMTKEIHKRLKNITEVPDVFVLGNPQWRPALVGLAANKIAEEYNRPAFLWGKDGNGVIKGSCRSNGTTSVVKIMEAIADDFLEYGGHHMSGGFSVKEDSIFSLPERLNTAFVELGSAAATDVELVIDAYLDLEEVDGLLFKTLQTLAPYGVGNTKPLFAFKDVVPSNVEMFGKAKEHLKLQFHRAGRPLEAIAFFATPDGFQAEIKKGQKLTLLAHAEESFFMGRMQQRLRIVDVLENSV